MNKNPKILYISDSLGSPIHPRGIFNFSLSFIEILKKLGGNVTLVVEGASGYGIKASDFRIIRNESSNAINIVRIAELMRYFYEGRFIHWTNIQGKFGGIPAIGPLLAGAVKFFAGAKHFLRERLFGRRMMRLENTPGTVDFLPQKISHLEMMDNFLVGPRFYSSSMSAGVNGFVPVTIDATGYDLVVVDTPHFVTISGVAPTKIISVVHDIIPLQDPTMSADWRKLFLRKLESTLKTGGVMVFVSKTTRDAYYNIFKQRNSEQHAIIYPPVRQKLMAIATASIENALKIELRSYIPKDQVGLAKNVNWNLPFFVTPTSDEPRKNIGVLTKAFRQLRGLANIVIVGDVNRARYATDEDLQNVFFTGYISDEAKNTLIFQSAGLIFPSLSEGFGIPIIEGGVLKRPVICSKIRVFEEISAGHAVYFDPANATELAQAVVSTLANPDKCRANADAFFDFILEHFSQDAMAQETRKLLNAMGVHLAADPL